MKDTLYCPICMNKLSNKVLSNFTANCEMDSCIQRSCKEGINHFFSLLVTRRPHYKPIMLLLNLGSDKSVQINFEKQISSIVFHKFSNTLQIKVPRVIELDFPSLKKLKAKMKNYVTFF